MAGKKLNTNDVAIEFAQEPAFGIVPGADPADAKATIMPSSWQLMEPNEISNYGGSISTVARQPISPDRQRRKGVITDFEAEVDITSDLTVSEVENWAAGFLLCSREGLTQPGKSTGVTIPTSGTASYEFAEAKITDEGKNANIWNLNNAILFASGFTNEANNGRQYAKSLSTSGTGTVNLANLTTISSSLSGGGEKIQLANAGDRVIETSSNGVVDVIGYRGTTGSLSFENGKLTLRHETNRRTRPYQVPPETSETAAQYHGWELLGLQVGQWIFIGQNADTKAPDAGKSARFTIGTTGYNVNGWHKISAIGGTDSTELSFDDIASNVTNTSATSTMIEVYFGSRWHNVSTTEQGLTRSNRIQFAKAGFSEQYFRFGALYKDIAADNTDGYEYVTGASPNTWTISMPLTEKATSQLAFVCKEAETIKPRLTSAAEATPVSYNKAFNTSSDFGSLNLYDDERKDISTLVKSIDLTITNNYSAEKVLATTGAAFMNLGTLEVSGSIEALFTDQKMIDDIRANKTVKIFIVLKNEDGAILIEIPACTLAGGGKEFTINETVKISLDASAYRDDVYNDSINIQTFKYLP